MQGKLKENLRYLIQLFPEKLRNELYLFYLGNKLVRDKKSFLVETGYANSKLTKRLQDLKGEPIPWMNYSTIFFLDERLDKTIKMLEYGSGASTLFFASKCESVISIEHDERWFNSTNSLIKTNGITNVRLIFSPLGEDYISVKRVVEEDEKFDLILIDGEFRVETAVNSLSHLNHKGVLILDDSDREIYKPVHEFYEKNNFTSLNLKGIKPGGYKTDQTTIFYRRSLNCLGL